VRELTFTIRFHGPFLIGSGLSGGGLDETARATNLVPAESLKGAMRASAERIVRVPPQLVQQIFGAPGTRGGAAGDGAWAWNDAGPASSFIRHRRARNRIDATTRLIQPEALAFTEEVWQEPGSTVTFSVEPKKYLDEQVLRGHSAILRASSYGVTALGQWRNRGAGTVTVRPIDTEIDLSALTDILGGPR